MARFAKKKIDWWMPNILLAEKLGVSRARAATTAVVFCLGHWMQVGVRVHPIPVA